VAVSTALSILIKECMGKKAGLLFFIHPHHGEDLALIDYLVVAVVGWVKNKKV
jgi:hypothetical protein